MTDLLLKLKNIFKDHSKGCMAGLGLVIILILLLLIKGCGSSRGHGGEAEAAEPTIAAITSLTPEELEQSRRADILMDIVLEYDRFGIVSTENYINLRSRPDSLDMTNIIGKLSDGAAVDIIGEEGDWLQVRSGEIEGYINRQYVLEDEEALEKAWYNLCDRVIIGAEVLNIRSAPVKESTNVIGKARAGERYALLGVEGDWAKIAAENENGAAEGYVNISDGNGEIKHCLDAARKLDLRTMALTQYDNVVFSYPEGGFVNIRKKPEDDGIDNICGKFIKGSGAELLETVENSSGTWYKIKSGKVTGYVNSSFCLTGQAARETAVEYAKLTAFVKVDALNVRSEPSLDASVWTSITRDQAYEVINQLDGWVELELDNGDGDGDGDRAFVSTRDNNVEVRYGLAEAVEYYPAVEAANAAMAFRNQICNYGCQFIGNPYVWGGTSLTKGADCSGFVQSVMAHYGISLPRTSAEQAGCGTKVTSDKMKPGDLVFYANSSGRVNHVGIYIGNGQIVNAASQKSGIKISRWNYRTPVAIRNVIGQ